MRTLTFVTGNKEKIRDAMYVAKDYDVTIEPVAIEIDEIQHHDPLKISEHKAKSAFGQLRRPLVINDSFWSIPALGGFLVDT